MGSPPAGEGIGDEDRARGRVVVDEVLAREPPKRRLDLEVEGGCGIGELVRAWRCARPEALQDPAVEGLFGVGQEAESLSPPALGGNAGRDQGVSRASGRHFASLGLVGL